MATEVTFISCEGWENVESQDTSKWWMLDINSPFNSDDMLVIINPGFNFGGFNIFDVSGHCGAVLTPGSIDGAAIIRTGKQARGLAGKSRITVIHPHPDNNALFVQSKKLTNMSPGTTCIEFLNGETATFQLYTADLD